MQLVECLQRNQKFKIILGFMATCLHSKCEASLGCICPHLKKKKLEFWSDQGGVGIVARGDRLGRQKIQVRRILGALAIDLSFASFPFLRSQP